MWIRITLMWIRILIFIWSGSGSVADSGCLSRIFTHPGSRIQDSGSKNSNKREGWKKNYHTFFVVTNFKKLNITLFLECWRKKFGPIFKELLKFLLKKLSLNSQKYGYGIRDPGSGKNQGPKRHRISDPDPQHWDPDPDPDVTFHPDADPDPDHSFQRKTQTLEKVTGSYSIHFGLSSANWCGSGSSSGSSLSLWCGSGFLFDTDADSDADPGYINGADPDPQYCITKKMDLVIGTDISLYRTTSNYRCLISKVALLMVIGQGIGQACWYLRNHKRLWNTAGQKLLLWKLNIDSWEKFYYSTCRS